MSSSALAEDSELAGPVKERLTACPIFLMRYWTGICCTAVLKGCIRLLY